MCSSRTGKLWCWKSEQWLPVGKGLLAGTHKGSFCGDRNVSLHWGVVYMDVPVCQNSWDCTLKICVCKIYVKKKKQNQRNLTQVWVIRIDQQRARLKMNLPPLSLQFIQGLLSHMASLPLVHTEESRTELEGLISKEQLCPFLSLEMREIIPGPPRGICFCSDSIQIPDYLTPLGDSRLKLNQYRAILSEHSRRLRGVQGGLHQNVTSADTRETGLQRSRETWAAPCAISGVPDRNA